MLQYSSRIFIHCNTGGTILTGSKLNLTKLYLTMEQRQKETQENYIISALHAADIGEP